MNGKPNVSVTEEGAGRFRVEVSGEGGTTNYAVTVPAGYPAELGCEGVPATRLVSESFGFLLEREPPASILRSFSLDVITRYFPEYPAEIRRRLGG